MAQRFAEVVFVSGPQKGERVALRAAVVIAGRSPSCELALREDFVSRQQVRFEYTPDGVVVENLSDKGTKINGKKYKAGKRILLATGDMVGVGIETEMLFVAAGDDAQEALEAYQHPGGQAPLPTAAVVDVEEPVAGDGVQAVQPPPAPAGWAKPPPIPPPAAAGGTPPSGPVIGSPLSPRPGQPGPEEGDQTAAAVDDAAANRTRKIKKYIIFFGVYAACMIAGIIALKSCQTTEQRRASGPEVLSDRKIEEILLYRDPAQRRVDPVKANEAIEEARKNFPKRREKPGNRYLLLKSYHAYLAHKEGSGDVFPEPEDAENRETVRDELVGDVQRIYHDAYNNRMAGKAHWPAALALYNKLIEMVPEMEPDSYVYKHFVSNVIEHRAIVAQQLAP